MPFSFGVLFKIMRFFFSFFFLLLLSVSSYCTSELWFSSVFVEGYQQIHPCLKKKRGGSRKKKVEAESWSLTRVSYTRIERKRGPAVTGTSGGDCYHLWWRVDGGLGEQGGHTAAPPVCFGTRIKHYISLLNYTWLSHMHKCMEIHMHTHTWPWPAAEHFPRFEPSWHSHCYLTLCCP